MNANLSIGCGSVIVAASWVCIVQGCTTKKSRCIEPHTRICKQTCALTRGHGLHTPAHIAGCVSSGIYIFIYTYIYGTYASSWCSTVSRARYATQTCTRVHTCVNMGTKCSRVALPVAELGRAPNPNTNWYHWYSGTVLCGGDHVMVQKHHTSAPRPQLTSRLHYSQNK